MSQHKSTTKPKTKPSPEIDAKIIELYASGKDAYLVADECGCSQTFVQNTLKRYNIPRRTTYSYTTIYPTNEKFFDIVDTEEKAYILGFYYADGNNYVGNENKYVYEIGIALQEEDKYILERFRDLLSPQSKLEFIERQNKNINWKNMYRLKIHSKILSQQLINLGCVPAKALILTFPQWLVDDKLIQHFIRGYFDGDGSLWAKRPGETGKIDWGWTITSSANFCSSVKQYLEEKLSIHFTQKLVHSTKNNITTTISTGGNIQVRKVLDWMYQDATIYLPRKYAKYLEFIEQQNITQANDPIRYCKYTEFINEQNSKT